MLQKRRRGVHRSNHTVDIFQKTNKGRYRLKYRWKEMVDKLDNSCVLIPNVLMIWAFASARMRWDLVGREKRWGTLALPPQGLHNVLTVQVHGVLDGFAGSCSRQEVVDGHLLVLVLLVCKNRFGQETTRLKGAIQQQGPREI